jgi:KEOPS complex subunit Cgi121
MMIVIGARGTISDIDDFLSKIQSFSQTKGIVVQACDARMVYGKDHLMSAAIHAHRAFRQGTNATNSLPLEILLYAAGERQIHKAIKKIGVKQGRQCIAFILIDERKRQGREKQYEATIEALLRLLHCARDDTVLQGDRDTLKRFGVSDPEIQTIPKDKYGDLILEKIAMVDIIK